eukprot:EG_transcript_14473
MYGPYGFKGGMRPPLMGYAGVPAYTPGYAGPRGRQAMLMPGDWCCPNSACGYLNFAKRAECQVCSTPKNYDGPKLYDVPRSYYYPPGHYPPDWKCLQCDNINFARRHECKQCNAPRTANSPPTHVSQQYQPDWRCTSCGNINFSRRTECKQCSKPRTADAEPAYAPNHAALKASQQFRAPKAVTMGPGDWNCLACGFMNFARRTECLQCKAEKPDAPPAEEPITNGNGNGVAGAFQHSPY